MVTSNFAVQCDEVFFVVCWALSCWVSLCIPHALKCGSAKTLGNPEDVREGTFVRECSQRESSRGNVRKRTFVKIDGRENFRPRTFARGDLQGHHKERPLSASIYASMLVNVSIYATDANKTLLPWNIFIALRASRLLYAQYNLVAACGFAEKFQTVKH